MALYYFFTLHILYCIQLVALHTIVKKRDVAIRVIELDSGRYDKEVTRCRKTVRYMSVPSIMSLLSKLFKILFSRRFKLTEDKNPNEMKVFTVI